MPGGPGIRDPWRGHWARPASPLLSPRSNLPGPAASAPGCVCSRRCASGTVALTRLSRQPAPATEESRRGPRCQRSEWIRLYHATVATSVPHHSEPTVDELGRMPFRVFSIDKDAFQKNRSASLPSRAASPHADVALFKHRVSSRTPCVGLRTRSEHSLLPAVPAMTNEALSTARGLRDLILAFHRATDPAAGPPARPRRRRYGAGLPVVGRTAVRVGDQLEDAQWVTI